ncbi:MAG: acyltransferase [Spirulina sp. SIO3F2]|nr:acyltransferase [Spirulina sp. SIO3F2]
MSAVQPQPITYLPALTSMRGIAAIMVTLHHLSITFLKPWGDAIAKHSQLLNNSYLWVDFFFILSGFILTHVYAQTFGQQVRKTDYSAFLRSRFARIYPLHFFTLLWFVALQLAYLGYFVLLTQRNPGQPVGLDQPFTGNYSLPTLGLNLLLLQVFDPTSPPWFKDWTYWNEPAWSISAEWLIYLILPLLVMVLLKQRVWLSGVIYAIALICVFGVYQAGNLNLVGLPSLVRCAAECITGILTYRVYQSGQFKAIFQNDGFLICSLLVSLGIMSFDWQIPLSIPVFCLMLLALSHNQGMGQTVLSSKPLSFLGMISYSIYLTHWFLIKVLVSFWTIKVGEKYLAGASWELSSAIALLLVGVVIGISTATYYGVEFPMRKRLKRWLA